MKVVQVGGSGLLGIGKKTPKVVGIEPELHVYVGRMSGPLTIKGDFDVDGVTTGRQADISHQVATLTLPVRQTVQECCCALQNPGIVHRSVLRSGSVNLSLASVVAGNTAVGGHGVMMAVEIPPDNQPGVVYLMAGLRTSEMMNERRRLLIDGVNPVGGSTLPLAVNPCERGTHA